MYVLCIFIIIFSFKYKSLIIFFNLLLNNNQNIKVNIHRYILVLFVYNSREFHYEFIYTIQTFLNVLTTVFSNHEIAPTNHHISYIYR